MRGGGTVQLSFTDALTLLTPVLVADDTILMPAAAGGTATVSGGSRFRLFHVLPGVRFEIRDVVLRDGLSTNGGAIFNEGILLASNVLFAASQAVGTAGIAGTDGAVEFGFGDDGTEGTSGFQASGGAVDSAGDATFIQCKFSANAANGGKGGDGGKGGAGSVRAGHGGEGGVGAPGFGGAISSVGRLVVAGCAFEGNAARGGDGGAGGSNGTILGAGQGAAGARAAGGAIFSAGSLMLTQSTFTTNLVAGGSGAAAAAPFTNIGLDGAGGGSASGGAVASWSTGVVVNTTFYTNLIAGGSGGSGAAGTFTAGDGGRGGDALGAGIHVRGRLDVTNVTFAWNSGTNGVGGTAGGTGSQDGSPGRLGGSAIAADAGAHVTVVNSILAANDFSTVDGPLLDYGHNLFTDAGPSAPSASSLLRTDPILGGYQVWSTGLAGCLPLSGSPVVDAADPASIPPVDQRGFPRPAGAGPDIGALEVGVVSFRIGGLVLNGDQGMAGVGVLVGTNRLVTDSSGGFLSAPLTAGFYILQVEEHPEVYTPRVVQLSLASDITNVVFRVVRTTLSLVHSAVTGTDVLSGGGVPNVLYRLEGCPDLKVWQVLQSNTSDGQGRVGFTWQPGDVGSWFYRLAVP